MPEYLSPGVYIEEVEAGPKPIEGVSTRTAGMVGVTLAGPTDGKPELVTSFAEFVRKFGGFLSSPTPPPATGGRRPRRGRPLVVVPAVGQGLLRQRRPARLRQARLQQRRRRRGTRPWARPRPHVSADAASGARHSGSTTCSASTRPRRSPCSRATTARRSGRLHGAGVRLGDAGRPRRRTPRSVLANRGDFVEIAARSVARAGRGGDTSVRGGVAGRMGERARSPHEAGRRGDGQHPSRRDGGPAFSASVVAAPPRQVRRR